MIFEWPDAINGLVELTGTAAVLLSLRRVVRNRKSEDVHPSHVAYGVAVNYWSVCYYWNLEQPISFWCGVVFCAAMTAWAATIAYYCSRETNMTRWEYFKWAFFGNEEDSDRTWRFWWRNPAHNWCYHGGGRKENGWFLCYPSAGPEAGKLWCYIGHRPFSMKRTADGGLTPWPGAFGCKPPRWETITEAEAWPMRQAIAILRLFGQKK